MVWHGSYRFPVYNEMDGVSMNSDTLTIEKLKSLYPYERDSDYFYVSDYGPLDALIGEEVVCVSDPDYQGETRILYQKMNEDNMFDDMYTVRTYYWGSCSGCDALQACSSWEDLLDYAQSHIANVQWFNREELIQHLDNIIAEHEKSNYWGYHCSEEMQFLRECYEYLGVPVPNILK